MLFLVLLLFAALIFDTHTASAAAQTALDCCARLIIPSLFPFFVLSSLLNRLGLSQRLSRIVKIKGISAFFTGICGGYPLGAAAVARMYTDGELTREEAEALLGCCNNTGPAFIIGAVGSGVFGSLRCGITLYLVHIASALAVWALVGMERASPLESPQHESFASAFTASVKQSVISVINVCGYVVCFSVLVRLLRLDALSALLGGTENRTEFFTVFFTGIFELGTAVSEMQGLEVSPAALALAAFVLGFGGLSVHCQTAAEVQDAGLDTTLHFWCRVLAGSIAALMMYLISVLI